MWPFAKNLFQLILAPARGWEDISATDSSFENLVRKGYIPLVIIAALSEFIPLAYVGTLTFLEALESCIAIGGGLFASLFAARLLLDVTLKRYIDPDLSDAKIANLALYLLGLDCYYRIFANILPASLTFLSFLPLISIVVLFKSTTYMGIGEDRAINYLIITFTGVVALPLIICKLLSIII